jgi:hypothetical protein
MAKSCAAAEGAVETLGFHDIKKPGIRAMANARLFED